MPSYWEVQRVPSAAGDVLEDIHTPMHGRVLALTTGMAVDPAPRADGDQWLARTVTIAEDPGAPWAT